MGLGANRTLTSLSLILENLIKDKKITLIDTVKHYLFDEMLSRIKDVIEPEKIDYIVSNHVEMDQRVGPKESGPPLIFHNHFCPMHPVILK